MALPIDGALHWLSWGVCSCVCVFLCVHVTINLILAKPDASFCLGLMVCQLTKYLTCFYLHHTGLVRRQELLSSILPVTASPWSNRFWLYPCIAAATMLVQSSEDLSGPVLSSLIHSGLALLCHLTTLNPFLFFFATEWVLHCHPPPLLLLPPLSALPPCSPPSFPYWRD